MSFPGTAGFLQPFLDVPFAGDILHSSAQAQPSRSLRNLDRTPRPGNWTAFLTALLRTILAGNLFISFVVPCAICIELRALASSKTLRNAVAAQISPNINILTKGGEFSINFRTIW